ncbi:MAG: hypothetical protein RLZZ292_752 [Bacteroidota bacterium]|jgi:hypothetical protein
MYVYEYLILIYLILFFTPPRVLKLNEDTNILLCWNFVEKIYFS